MQKSTKTTVYLDGTEIREIVAAHLRAEGALPEGAKFDVRFTPGRSEDHPGLEFPQLKLEQHDSLRISVSYPVNLDAPIVAKFRG